MDEIGQRGGVARVAAYGMMIESCRVAIADDSGDHFAFGCLCSIPSQVRV